MSTVVNAKSNSAKRLGLDNVLDEYHEKTFAYLQKKQDELIQKMYKTYGTDVNRLLTNIKEILTPMFKHNEGMLREATYTAILQDIDDGKFKELLTHFTMSVPDVSQKLASSGVSIGRIVGTAYLHKKGGARRRTRKAVRRTRKMRSRK